MRALTSPKRRQTAPHPMITAVETYLNIRFSIRRRLSNVNSVIFAHRSNTVTNTPFTESPSWFSGRNANVSSSFLDPHRGDPGKNE